MLMQMTSAVASAVLVSFSSEVQQQQAHIHAVRVSRLFVHLLGYNYCQVECWHDRVTALRLPGCKTASALLPRHTYQLLHGTG
jgi:hypothetical protein